MTDLQITTPPPIKPLAIGSTIGILGGGQLGRMLAMAAADLGMKTHIYCPDADSPAFEVSAHHTIAAYDDFRCLEKFAKSVDVVTYEFENVPANTARHIEKFATLKPGQKPLEISQDRLLEKQFLQSINIPICPFDPVTTRQDLNRALLRLGTPAVLKTTRLGYDGKGQRIIKSMGDAEQAYMDLAGVELVLEAFVPFEKEISVLIARNENGDISAYDPAENVHKHHILHTSTVPADLEKETATLARSIANNIVQALDYVGVLAVEFFVIRDAGTQKLLVNEIAPRVHNSGHWSQNVCPVDQFSQHIRAICNWPLGDTTRLADVKMTNLIGDEVYAVHNGLTARDHPHIYGKTNARPGRKMGHINSVSPLLDNSAVLGPNRTEF